MARFLALSVAALALVACAPPAPKPVEEAKPAAPAIAPPPEGFAANFPDCTWGAVTGGGVTLNAFSCPTVKLVADEALPGIVQVMTMEDGKELRSPVVQVFAKAPDAPIDAVLAAVRKASPGGETCVLTPDKDAAPESGRQFYKFTPTGKAKEKYEADLAGKSKGEINLMPCGQYGPTEAGSTTFETHAAAPGKVVMVVWPSDIPPFDYKSLAVTP